MRRAGPLTTRAESTPHSNDSNSRELVCAMMVGAVVLVEVAVMEKVVVATVVVVAAAAVAVARAVTAMMTMEQSHQLMRNA